MRRGETKQEVYEDQGGCTKDEVEAVRGARGEVAPGPAEGADQAVPARPRGRAGLGSRLGRRGELPVLHGVEAGGDQRRAGRGPRRLLQRSPRRPAGLAAAGKMVEGGAQALPPPTLEEISKFSRPLISTNQLFD